MDDVSAAPARLVVQPGTTDERTVPVFDRLVVGRECAGIDPHRALVIDDHHVSRHHFEIRLDHEHGRAALVDLSTNGTRLNGVRVERGVSVPIRTGDRLSAGGYEMEFVSTRFASTRGTDPRRTIQNLEVRELVLVVGDIVGYSTLSQVTKGDVLYHALEQLYRALRRLLDDHAGTFVHYQGDAFFAAWELDDPAAIRRAVGFARAAVATVATTAPKLALRHENGAPITMGWAVVAGEGVVSSLTGTPMTVLGDATNLAFRLSGMAGRDGRPPIVVTSPVRDVLGDAFRVAAPEEVAVKGRSGHETVYGLLA